MTKYVAQTNLNKNIFRAYDIRGIFGEGINENTMYTLGLVLASKVEESGSNKVIVGRDGRLSGPVLCQALIAGLLAGGCDVTFIGEVPSPVLYFATHKLGIKSGFIVTGSHNPKDYNGLKMVIDGMTLAEDEISDIFNRVKEKKYIETGVGRLEKKEIFPLYTQDILERVKLQRPLKVVIDCGNGVAGNIAPQLFRELGCNVIDLYADVDGNFPNHHPNPSVAENLIDLQASVALHNADVGIAFDGDADRVGIVANNGKVIWPDRLMMLYSKDILARNKNAKIVFDVKCSSFLADVISDNGGIPIQWRTGHSVLKAKMVEEQAAIAGEMSGHIFFRDNWYGFDDGIYAGVRLLQILSKKNKSCADIFSELPEGINTPEILVHIPDEKKFVFINKLIAAANFSEAKVNTIDGLLVNFPDGWALVRASNTTPALTLRFEALSADRLQDIKNNICDLMQEIDPDLDLSLVREAETLV